MVLTKSIEKDWEDRGYSYQYDQVITLPFATNKYFLFDPTGISDDIVLNVFPFHVYNCEDGPVTVNYYAGSDYSGGTPLTLLNRNGNSTNTAATVIYENPTGSSLGLKTSSNKVAIGGALPSQAGGGSSGEKEAFVASKNVKFLVEIVNDSGADITAEAYLIFSEPPSQYI